MTTFLLVRHGETDAVGNFLAGWMPDCHLNRNGKQQALRLAQKLSRLPIREIYTSPLERAVETAEAIAAPHGLVPRIRERLGEMRFGGWEGQTFEQLETHPEWRCFNTVRSAVRPPGGESMSETQMRMIAEMDSLRAAHPDQTVVLVSHCDPLRSVIAHYLGASLDLLLRFEIDPASVSVLQSCESWSRILCLNCSGEFPA